MRLAETGQPRVIRGHEKNGQFSTREGFYGNAKKKKKINNFLIKYNSTRYFILNTNIIHVTILSIALIKIFLDNINRQLTALLLLPSR